MDSLTQILVGIATVEATAGRKLGNRSFLYGAFLGTFPDFDVVAGWLMNPVDAAAFHRSFTHSILGILLCSPLLGYLLHRIEKTRLNFWPATAVVATTLVTHVLLDLFTAWGVQLLFPLDSRFSFKSIFVVDVFYTACWMIALLGVYFTRNYWRKRFLAYGFYLSSSYLLIGLFTKGIAVNRFEEALAKDKIHYEELIVKPTFSNFLLWQANVKTPTHFLLADYAFTDTSAIVFKTHRRQFENELPFANQPEFDQLSKISEGWYTVTEENGAFYFNDLRFGLLPQQKSADEPRFVFSYLIANSPEGLQVSERKKTTREGKEHLNKLLERIKNRGAISAN